MPIDKFKLTGLSMVTLGVLVSTLLFSDNWFGDIQKPEVKGVVDNKSIEFKSATRTSFEILKNLVSPNCLKIININPNYNWEIPPADILNLEKDDKILSLVCGSSVPSFYNNFYFNSQKNTYKLLFFDVFNPDDTKSNLVSDTSFIPRTTDFVVQVEKNQDNCGQFSRYIWDNKNANFELQETKVKTC